MATEANTFGQPKLVFASGTFTASHPAANPGGGSVNDPNVKAGSRIVFDNHDSGFYFDSSPVYVSNVYDGGFDWVWPNPAGIAFGETRTVGYVAFAQDSFSFGV